MAHDGALCGLGQLGWPPSLVLSASTMALGEDGQLGRLGKMCRPLPNESHLARPPDCGAGRKLGGCARESRASYAIWVNAEGRRTWHHFPTHRFVWTRENDSDS
ncbi:hypothetical protein LZ30DRAFT_687919 [Colletotrichum cereale]|nr:hypothetical protein LZ30DRAFT_687919 [Colletotrichum cereale]